MPMNGIDPPSPNVIGVFPKYAFDARSTDCSSHGATFGATQPPPPFSGSKSTRAPYGGSLSSRFFSLRSRSLASSDGGTRSERLIDLFGRNTLPPCCKSGKPACPVYASSGRHVRLMSSCSGSFDTGCTPGANGNLLQTSLPCTCPGRFHLF